MCEAVHLRARGVETYKDRATIQDVTFTFDAALDHAKSVGKGSSDGNVHIAGRSTKVGPPMVAEIITTSDDTTAARAASMMLALQVRCLRPMFKAWPRHMEYWPPCVAGSTTWAWLYRLAKYPEAIW